MGSFGHRNRLMTAALLAATLLGCMDEDVDAGSTTVCGGIAGLRCDTEQFCDFEGSALVCGRFDGQGVCKSLPRVCTYEFQPVCGCDGATYATACAAHVAGVSVEHDGACAGTP
ncbi:MAG: hypothetical protein ABW252_17360 [Polyangiales bacterium]